jgi:hypothetical protein
MTTRRWVRTKIKWQNAPDRRIDIACNARDGLTAGSFHCCLLLTGHSDFTMIRFTSPFTVVLAAVCLAAHSTAAVLPDNFTCPPALRPAAVEEATERAMECFRAMAPEVMDALPHREAAVESHPVAVGPADLTCHGSPFASAKMKQCSATSLFMKTLRQRVAKPGTTDAASSLFRICEEELAHNELTRSKRRAQCVGAAQGVLTWSSTAIADQQLYCSLLGTCGTEALSTVCRHVVLPTARAWGECTGRLLAIRKKCALSQTPSTPSLSDRLTRLHEALRGEKDAVWRSAVRDAILQRRARESVEDVLLAQSDLQTAASPDATQTAAAARNGLKGEFLTKVLTATRDLVEVCQGDDSDQQHDGQGTLDFPWLSDAFSLSGMDPAISNVVKKGPRQMRR